MLQFLPDSTLLFTLAVSSAAVELGLTAYLMIAGSHVRGASVFVLLPLICFEQRFYSPVDRSFSSSMHFGPSCSSRHACCGLRDAAWIYWLIYLAQFFGFSPRRLSGYCLAIQWHARFLSPVLQGSTLAFVHNTRARKSCTGIPSDMRYTPPLVPVENADLSTAARTTYLPDPWHGWSSRSA
jgi:hypothetical protein